MFDFMWKPWKNDIPNVAGSWDLPNETLVESEFLISVGYQRDGSTIFYDSFISRMTYRAGAWYKNGYLKDVSEVGGSIGLGFPLGSVAQRLILPYKEAFALQNRMLISMRLLLV